LYGSKLYTIGEMARIVGMPTKTLRFYDQKDVLKPETRNKNSYRYYSEKQILEAMIIKILRQLGLSLTDIKNVLLQKNIELLRENLATHIHELEQQIKEELLQLQIAKCLYNYINVDKMKEG